MSSLLELLITRSLRLPCAPLQSMLVRSRPCSPSRPSCTTSATPLILRASNATKRANTSQRRGFHTTVSCSKKGGAKASKNTPSEAPSAGDDDPNDFSELQASITKAQTDLKESLSKLRAGGKFNPELVDNLRVSLDKSSKQTTRLGDLAQCVPRGRTLNVIAGEKDHAKAISSAILNSNLNLTPQVDAQNPLQLNIQLPTPTAESRQGTVKEAQGLADKASTAVRNARGVQQKKHRSMTLGRAARPDDLKKASDKMEKVVADGSAEVKRILDNAKKVLESG